MKYHMPQILCEQPVSSGPPFPSHLFRAREAHRNIQSSSRMTCYLSNIKPSHSVIVSVTIYYDTGKSHRC